VRVTVTNLKSGNPDTLPGDIAVRFGGEPLDEGAGWSPIPSFCQDSVSVP